MAVSDSGMIVSGAGLILSGSSGMGAALFLPWGGALVVTDKDMGPPGILSPVNSI
jgi:hypothetical protein